MDKKLIQELLSDHSSNPRNYGELPNPDLSWQTENPQCVGPTHPKGDQVALDVALSDETPPRVEAVRFTGEGCTLSQATASLLTEQMHGSSVEEIQTWDSETLEDLVGMDLTPSRLKCAELALVAFRNAMEASDLDS